MLTQPSPPANSHVEILIPIMVLLEGGAFGRWLDYKSGALMSRVGPFAKEVHRAALSFLPCNIIHQEIYNPEEGPHPIMLAP